MSELKPCPFCGDSADFAETFSVEPPHNIVGGIVYCVSSLCKCYVEGDSRTEATKRWNRRADIPWLPDELVERIRQQTCSFMPDQVADAVWRNNLLCDILAVCEGKE
jgi:hypothetical protein